MLFQGDLVGFPLVFRVVLGAPVLKQAIVEPLPSIHHGRGEGTSIERYRGPHVVHSLAHLGVIAVLEAARAIHRHEAAVRVKDIDRRADHGRPTRCQSSGPSCDRRTRPLALGCGESDSSASAGIAPGPRRPRRTTTSCGRGFRFRLSRWLGALLRGARLAATGDWATAHDSELNEFERAFLTASRQASEREAERQRRANRRLRGLLIGALVLLALAVLAGAVALLQRSHARTAQAKAEAQALRSDAERLGTLAGTETDLGRSLLLAVAGVKLQDLPETRGALLAVLQKNPAAFRVIRPSRAAVSALAVSPDGRLVASGDSAGAVHFVDLRTWEARGPTVRLDASVSLQGMTFSPDGRTLAVVTATGTRSKLNLVDVASRAVRPIGSWPSPIFEGPLRLMRVAFSPDGRRIAVAVARDSLAKGLLL